MILTFFIFGQGRVTTHPHPVPPYALSWPLGCVIAAGCDKRVTIYDRDGRISHQFDYSKDETEHEFTVACASPSGQAVCIGSFDKYASALDKSIRNKQSLIVVSDICMLRCRLRLFAWNPRKQSWEEEAVKEINHLYTVTALAWKRDGSRVAVGALCGSIELFESVIK